MISWNEKTVNVSALKPFERNPRKISARDLDELKKRISEDGYHQRILATNDFRIIGGHQRIRVLKELGITQIQILVPDVELPDDIFRRILIKDNIGLGEFDLDILREDYAAELLLDFGMPQEIMRQLERATQGLTDPDSVPDVPSDPSSRLGDIWLLGDHRLACGDCTNAVDVEKLLADAKPHIMVTDPPYGVEYDPNWRNEADRANGKPYGDRAIGTVNNDGRTDWRQAWALFPGEVAYIWHAGVFAAKVAESLEASAFEIRAQIIWSKNNAPIGRGHYHWKHEPCWYAVRAGGTGHWQGARDQATVWEIDKPQKSETGHSTQKPIECMRRPIENNSATGDSVYDPFVGSGTTLIAAEMLGRKCFSMELNPAYVDVAILRWQEFTGQLAIHAVTGKPFGE